MGKFTEYDDPSVDRKIELQLGKIVTIIKESISGVRSVILAGSFGRGEGSVDVVGSVVVPLKDYDIYVIADKIPNGSCKDRLNRKIGLALGLSKDSKSKFSGFNVDISFYTKTLLKSYLDITLWELKHASIVLYGEDVRSFIPWELQDIPLSNGLRFLFEKATGLTACFSERYLTNGNVGEKENEKLIYECYKTYVEIASVLCLAMGYYEPSYKKRLEVFRKRAKQEYPCLFSRVPELEENVIKGTRFKLKPTFDYAKEDICDLWFETRNALCEVFKLYFSISLKIEVNDWIDSYDELRKAMAYQYYRPVMRAALNVVGICNESLTSVANSLFLIYQKLTTAFRIIRNDKTLHLNPLFQLQSPLMTIYLSSILVMLSLKRNGELDARFSDVALENLRQVVPAKANQRVSWDDLRKLYLRAYEMHRGGAK